MQSHMMFNISSNALAFTSNVPSTSTSIPRFSIGNSITHSLYFCHTFSMKFDKMPKTLYNIMSNKQNQQERKRMSNINWILRFKNKTVLVALVAAVVAFVYQALGLFGIVPSVSSDQIIDVFGLLINVLVILGIVVDPTTEGVKDSELAQTYDSPKEY